MTSPELVFAELLEKTPERSGRAFRTFDGPEDLEVRAFLEGETRLPGVSFRLPRRLVPANWHLPRMRGAQLVVLPDHSQGKPAWVTYELSASEPAYTAVFVDLAARLISDATGEQSAEAALVRIRNRLGMWARFFEARGEQGLGRNAQLGLIGELLCLRQLGAVIGYDTAVEAWTGPTGSIHDFQNARGAIEVKLSTSSAPERLRITSERQLDDSAVPWLGLFAVLAQETAAGKVGLPQLVDETRAALGQHAPVGQGSFDERLLAAGYADSDRHRYQIRLAVHSQEFTRVHGDFPRIRPAELRQGVFSVAYDIPWSAVAPYRITTDELRRGFGVADERTT